MCVMGYCIAWSRNSRKCHVIDNDNTKRMPWPCLHCTELALLQDRQLPRFTVLLSRMAYDTWHALAWSYVFFRIYVPAAWSVTMKNKHAAAWCIAYFERKSIIVSPPRPSVPAVYDYLLCCGRAVDVRLCSYYLYIYEMLLLSSRTCSCCWLLLLYVLLHYCCCWYSINMACCA